MKKALGALLLFWIVVYFFVTRQENPPAKTVERPVPRPAAPGPSLEPPLPPPMPETAPRQLPEPAPPMVKVVEKNESGQTALPYKIQDNLFIVLGDVVAGAVPPGAEPPADGRVALDPLKLWPSAVIPYHIQPDVTDPDRILQALRMFDGTAVQFVKYESGDHALVFEQGTKNCLSYLGKVVPMQPVWISVQCSPADIAHEILHALGFLHEQNRADRDSHVDVNFDNIEEEHAHNFEKLPPEFMKVSGLGEFDFQSLMMYPPWMFAKSGRSTMEPRSRDRLIDPQPRLSPGDIDRLNRAYR